MLSSFSLKANLNENLYFINDTINQLNSEGKKEGFWLINDKTNQLKQKGSYSNGRKNGIWTSYYSNGNKKDEITYINGRAIGKANFYYEDGTLSETGDWHINHWEGNYKYYHKNGNIAYDWNYDKKGKRSGKQKYYHENGKPKYSGTWDNGKTIGSMKSYNEQGNLISTKEYVDGKVNEIVEVKEVSPSVSNQKHNNDNKKFNGSGFHIIYKLNGDVEEKGTYKIGELIDGERYIYNSDSQLVKIIMIKDSKEVGFRRP